MSEPKTFTQDQVNAIVAKETRPLRERVAALESEVRDYTTIKAELTTAATTLAAERDAARAEVQGWRDRHAAAVAAARQKAIGEQIAAALTEARALPEAMADAMEGFMRAAELQVNDEHAITAVTYDGTEYPTAKEAARKFMDARPWFEQARLPGGAGTRPGTAIHRSRRDPAENATAAQLMQEGWNRK